jgi:ubiquinone/menaquinone biosynthesis C-methylase UbiE
MKEKDKIRDSVKKAYGAVAGSEKSCCGPRKSCCGAEATAATLGEMGLSCGDPVMFSHLKAGQVVVDLGSGSGKDVFLAARAVGDKGRVIGVDMTPEMLALARGNAAKFREMTGLDNVEFREGTIEKLPIEDSTVDVVISNCVINLSPDKPAVFREVFRVLRPTGKMVVSDIVLNRPLPANLKNDAGLYAACIAGALMKDEYLRAIRSAGFASVDILSETLYEMKQSGNDPITAKVSKTLDGAASSITVEARK